jgi:hypothetical protein
MLYLFNISTHDMKLIGMNINVTNFIQDILIVDIKSGLRIFQSVYSVYMFLKLAGGRPSMMTAPFCGTIRLALENIFRLQKNIV